jgi:uncharacterized protein
MLLAAKPFTSRSVRVVSRKYDGSLRDEYETQLVEETAEAFTLLSPPGTPYLDHRVGSWQTAAPDGLLELYFPQRWYNLWHICEQQSSVNLMYINLSIPAMLRGDVLEWVDLDLDYRVHVDHSVELLDEAEFAENAARFDYPPELIAQVRAACREIEALLAERAFPFDHERQVERYRRLKALFETQ